MSQLSQIQYKRYLKEREELSNVKLPQLEEQIRDAKKEGDLSENEEYRIANEERTLGLIRMQELNNILDNSEVVDVTSTNEVGIGSLVTLTLVDKNNNPLREPMLFLVDSEGSPMDGILETRSPVGRNIIGLRNGDYVEALAPQGNTVKYKVDIHGEDSIGEFLKLYPYNNAIFKSSEWDSNGKYIGNNPRILSILEQVKSTPNEADDFEDFLNSETPNDNLEQQYLDNKGGNNE